MTGKKSSRMGAGSVSLLETRHRDLKALDIDAGAVDNIIRTIRSWHELGDSGMQMAIYRYGEPVLIVACGYDPFTNRPIYHDTLFCLLSTTKALASVVMLYLNAQGKFQWNDLISSYWPEFAQGGKETATIEHLMAHRLGIPTVTAPWQKWTDRDYMARLVERSPVQWTPGTCYGYHGGIFGFVVDELCRRLTGRSTGQILHQEIACRVGHRDCYMGIGPEQFSRLARLQFLEEDQRAASSLQKMPHPPLGPDSGYNNEAILASCQPSGGGVATAQDLAGVLNLLAGHGQYKGDQFWGEEAQEEASRVRSPAGKEAPASAGVDGGCWGLGFLVFPTPRVFGTVPPGPKTVGHAGASGSVAYADPDLGLSVAFTINGLLGRRQFRRYTILGDLVQKMVK